MAIYSCSDKADNSITVLTDEVKTGAVSVKGDTVCTFQIPYWQTWPG